jgi:3alpha(or 20beta)-hydroxysteroid dehydrogenase
MSELSNKVAIITGAASGQGAAEARLFASLGASVVLTDINAAGAQLAAEIGDPALFVRHDVTSPEEWDHVLDATLERFGTVDVLVNNAGIYKPLRLVDTDLDNFELHVRVNQRSVFLGMKAVIAPMRAAGGGSIINISSVNGLAGNPGSFAYSMSKWASRGMTKVAATELAGYGIRVNSVHPGMIDTPMLLENAVDRIATMQAYVPMKRQGSPDEVAQMVAFLASDRASYITGAEIAVAGGL